MNVIARIGANWSVRNKPKERAEKLIRAAKSSGASAVIVEYFEADKIYSDKKMIAGTKQHEMPPEWIYDLYQLAQEIGIDFIGTPRHPDHVDYLSKIGVVDYHIKMGDATYTPLVEAVADVAVGALLNVGLATLEEIKAAREIILGERKPDEADLVLLHSSGGFPTSYNDANLRRLLELGQEFYPTYFGIESFHSELLLDYMAMAYGPAIVVRTLDLGDGRGVESQYSVSPSELENLCKFAALAPEIVSPGYWHTPEFTETDWDFRTRLLRCEQSDWLLPPKL